MVRKLNRKAVESYSINFSGKVLDNFFSSKEVASGQDLLELTPVAQVNLLIIQRLYLRWQEETLRMRSPYFNYAHPQVQEALKAFMNTLSRHIKIDRHDLEPLLQSAVQDSLTLLLNPMAFFSDFLSVYTQPESLQASLRYLRWQQSLIDVLHEQIEQGEVTETEYLLAILEAGIRSGKLTLEEMDQHVEAYEQVLPLPVELVEESLEAAPKAPPAEEEEPADFFTAIARQAPRPSKPIHKQQAEALPAEEEVPVQEKAPAKAPETESSSEESPITPPAPAPRPEPVRATVQEAPKAATPPPAPTPPPAAESTPAPAPSPTPAAAAASQISKKEGSNPVVNGRFEQGDKKPLYAKFESKETRSSLGQRQGSSNIRNFITLNQRFMFTKELFKGDAAAFNAALDALDNCSTKQEAQSWIADNLAAKQQWQTNTEVVEEFQNVLEHRFGA